jgi:DnaJ-class molecular chaperone
VSQTDFYRVLGVDEKASSQEIKNAFRKLAFQYHPDRPEADAHSAEKMKVINEAYAVLSDPEKRRRYDAMRNQFGNDAYGQFRSRYTDQDIFRGSDIHSVFEEMARSFGLRGFDEIFKDFYGQGYQRFEFKRGGIRGGGFFFFGASGGPARRMSNQVLLGGLGRLAQMLLSGGAAHLSQNGADIEAVIRLDPDLARKGGPYAYYHRQSERKLVIKIPPGVTDGKRIRLSGLGEPGKAGGRPGDLYLKVKLYQPLGTKLKRYVKGLLSP